MVPKDSICSEFQKESSPGFHYRIFVLLMSLVGITSALCISYFPHPTPLAVNYGRWGWRDWVGDGDFLSWPLLHSTAAPLLTTLPWKHFCGPMGRSNSCFCIPGPPSKLLSGTKGGVRGGCKPGKQLHHQRCGDGSTPHSLPCWWDKRPFSSPKAFFWGRLQASFDLVGNQIWGLNISINSQSSLF